MINNPNDIGFIHDISNLDKLRQQAVNDKDGGEQKALEAAAKQFESIFTSMLFKSMREANSGFESDLMNSQNQLFYRQMLDEQMASELSSSGSLGLADMIVAQLSSGKGIDKNELAIREAGQEAPQRMPINRSKARETEQRLIESGQLARSDKARFDSPESFISSMKPYAERAAKSLGVEPSLLLAQAALETGWGQKVVKNARGSSNNLFNIKADRSWAGDKVTTQTLEFHDNTPVKETAAFRSYDSFADSFNDYVAFLNNNPRYQTALQHNGDSESFIRGIHRAGYATDPEYADKVLKVQQRIDNM
ncbi:flagellar assembly peptidoglycan hydrolase FlgJ [Vibrio sp. IRLE0018]|uniref:flagellar assembly peptidoglycan hydrolase FlgJ n=1 Tax=Vibrio TaxID=662 RepID=UPI001593088D|nr:MULTISPECIES: flagellar assembly peptidoglycan hydrolase FlgJ [Vibrio]MCF8779639.1 flagellar assembly peptidoglycan hydrolase FlgJ [Vibrio floridensis]NVC63753.1 flagellar assembly peptidoglycan hydrolase FlgJ [Vibrio sp. 05-20-BW147]